MNNKFIEKAKRAVVVVAGSFRLYQAVYLTYLFPEYMWDVVLITYGKSEEINLKLEKLCRKSQRFNDVIRANTPTQFSGTGKLMLECIKMTLYFLLGKRTVYAKQLINKNVDVDAYELICVACSYSLLEGAFLCLSREKKVIVMEEGLNDYVETKLKYGLIKTIGANLLFRMQYINLLRRSDYKPLKYCEKYIRYPQKIRENIYLKINKMLDFCTVSYDEFYNTIMSMFEINADNYDLVIYTSPLWQYGIADEYKLFEGYISENFRGKKILLKRHPQDSYIYSFKGVNVVEKYLEVPGELIMRKWNTAMHIFTFPSTILLGAELEEYKYRVISFKNVKNLAYHIVVKDSLTFLDITMDKVVEL